MSQMKRQNEPGAPLPFMIQRLAPNHHANAAAVSAWLSVLKKHRRACDEVWFLTELGFPRMSAHRRAAARMAQAAQKAREAGFLPALEIYCTLGHADLLMFPYDGIAWQRLVGPDGTTAKAQNCPRAEGLLAYCREMVRAYAVFQPSSVWINDDLRMHHHVPILYGCFCDTCLKAFGLAQGRNRNRAALVAALNAPEHGRLRLAWIRFNQESLAGIARAIGEPVQEVSPASRIGIEGSGPTWGLYSGADFLPTYKALAQCSKAPLGSRPGGGCYTDHRPREMIDKALNLAIEIDRLPPEVKVVCPEIENFPHTLTGKSPHGLAVESALDLAYGCNALSYAIFSMDNESSAAIAPQLARLTQWRPYLERLARDQEGTTPGGIVMAFGRHHAGRTLQAGEPPFAWAQASLSEIYPLATIGLPLCAGRKSASATILTATMVDGLGNGELEELLSGGVLANGETALRLTERGFAKKIGLRAHKQEQELFERFTRDPLNGAGKGRTWASVSFGSILDTRLEPLTPTARILGEYVSWQGTVQGAATVLTRTAFGGRLAVFGYRGWLSVVSSHRRRQLLSAADWVSRGRLPAIIDTTAQVVAVPRLTPRGRLQSVFLLNASIDRSPALALRLRQTTGRQVSWHRPLMSPRNVAATGTPRELSITLPAMAPWSVGHVRLEEARV